MKNVKKALTLTTAVSMLTVNTFSTAVYANGLDERGDTTPIDSTVSGDTVTSGSDNSKSPDVLENENSNVLTATAESNNPYLSPVTLPDSDSSSSTPEYTDTSDEDMANDTNLDATDSSNNTLHKRKRQSRVQNEEDLGFEYDDANQVLRISDSAILSDSSFLSNLGHSDEISKLVIEIDYTNIADEDKQLESDFFSDLTNLKEIDLSRCSGLKRIGSETFKGCGKLTTVTFPDSIQTINHNAFEDCTSLTTLDLSNYAALSTIGKEAFSGCAALETLILPKNMHYIRSGAFIGTALENITFPEDVSPNDPISNAIIEIGAFDDTSEDNNFPKANKIPDEFYNNITIAPGYDSGTDTYVIPEDILYIGNNAFNGDCGRVKKIIFHSNIKEIGNNAFEGSSDLEEVDLSECLNLTAIGNSTFYNCSNLTSIKLPNSLQTIEDHAFQSCSNLKEVDLSECSNLTVIGKYSFNDSSLTSIKLPDSLQVIKQDAFTGTSLTKVSVPEGVIIEIGAFDSNGNKDLPRPNKIPDEFFSNRFFNDGEPGYDLTEQTYTLPENILYIGNNAFDSCSNVKKIIFHSNIKEIGNNAFEDSYDLEEVDLSECLNLTAIGNSTFYNCRNLTSIKLPNSLRMIEDSAFTDCSSLEEVDLSECSNLTALGESAFSGCSKLTSVKLPDSLQIIKQYAFAGTNLTDISISDGVIIEMDAFDYKDGDKLPKPNKIPDDKFSSGIADGTDGFDTDSGIYTVPDTILYIGNNAFSDCSNLKGIILPGVLTEIGKSVFSDCGSLEQIDFSKCSNLNTIGSNAFMNCTALTGIDFSKCSNLNTIAFNAFKGCTNLTAIDLSQCSQLSTIGDNTFNGCSNLTSISFPDSLQEIGYRAFSNTKLTNITIPASVNTIGAFAFMDTALEEVRFEGTTPPAFDLLPFGDSSKRKVKILVPYDSWGKKNDKGKGYDDVLGGHNLWFIPKVAIESQKKAEGSQVVFEPLIRWHRGVSSYQYQWEKYDPVSDKWNAVNEASANSTYQISSITDADYGLYRCKVTAILDDKTTEEIISNSFTLDKESVSKNEVTPDPPADDGKPDKPSRPGRPGDSSHGNGNSGDSSQGNGNSGDSSQGNGNPGDSSQGNGNLGNSSQGNGNPNGISQGNGNPGSSSQGSSHSDGSDRTTKKSGKSDETDSIDLAQNTDSDSSTKNVDRVVASDTSARTELSDTIRHGINISLLILVAVLCFARIIFLILRNRRKDDE